MLKLTTDKHEASRGLSATAELLVYLSGYRYLGDVAPIGVKFCMMVHIGSGQKVSRFGGGIPMGNS